MRAKCSNDCGSQWDKCWQCYTCSILLFWVKCVCVCVCVTVQYCIIYQDYTRISNSNFRHKCPYTVWARPNLNTHLAHLHSLLLADIKCDCCPVSQHSLVMHCKSCKNWMCWLCMCNYAVPPCFSCHWRLNNENLSSVSQIFMKVFLVIFRESLQTFKYVWSVSRTYIHACSNFNALWFRGDKTSPFLAVSDVTSEDKHLFAHCKHCS